MQFADVYTFATVAVANTSRVHTFKGNSPYDPDHTGTGIASHGWVLYTQTYSNGRVVASKIILEPFTSESQPAWIFLTASPTPDVQLNFTTLKASGRYKSMLIGRDSVYPLKNRGQELEMTRTNQEVLRVDNADPNFVYSTGDPTQVWYYNVHVIDNLGASYNHQILITIQYLVEMWEPVN